MGDDETEDDNDVLGIQTWRTPSINEASGDRKEQDALHFRIFFFSDSFMGKIERKLTHIMASHTQGS